MKAPNPPRPWVGTGHDETLYWQSPPPEPSARCQWWVERIRNGWRPNGRISHMGYHERALWFGVYLWESLNVLSPLNWEMEAADADPKRLGMH